MRKSVFLRITDFLKWLAATESLPSPAPDPKAADSGRKSTFLKELFSHERLPVLEPFPKPLPDKPSFHQVPFHAGIAS